MSSNIPLNETETKTALITPALEKAGWKILVNMRQEYYFTAGQIIIQDNLEERVKGKFVDYALLDKAGKIFAIVEAKEFGEVLGNGLQQAIEYATQLQVKFVYSSNGKGFREHDMITGKENDLTMDEFPSQDELLTRLIDELKSEKKYTDDIINVISTPYYWEEGYKEPRYYQRIVIDKVVEAVALGHKRLMYVMATGTGKTFTAFQIVWRLLSANKVKKVLYLADRNILIGQTMSQDFKPLASVMTQFKSKKADSSFNVYMALYQQLVDYKSIEQPYQNFAKDFFDLIIIDECHRGSINENSEWHKILDYFDSAIHIGMTATPKSEEGADDFEYFGNPIYTYSLRQGIEDGYLAPYRVTHSTINVDESGYKAQQGEVDNKGNIFNEDKVYSRKDFERNISLINRQNTVVDRIYNMLKYLGFMTKTIIFCQDQQHADDLRTRLVNKFANKCKKNPKYVMRITSDDHEGKKALDDFITASCPYPVIVTTSDLLTTGVDCKTCALIVIDKEINNITTFKQIVGRGTRIFENDRIKKRHFDILDFRDATRWFSDDGFDPEPLNPINIPGVPTDDPTGEPPTGDDPTEPPTGDDPTGEPPTGEDPTGEPPTGEDPTGEPPTGEDPTEPPTGEDPTGEPPTGEDPTEPPTGEDPTEPPTGEDPTGEPPTGEDPTGEPPTGENPDNPPDNPPHQPPTTPKVRYVIDGRDIFIDNERVEVYDTDGKLITESIIVYSRKKILDLYPTIEEFKLEWDKEKKQKIVDELKDKAVLIENIRQSNPEYKDADIFDIICNVAFDKKTLTRKQRAKKVYDFNYFAKYDSRQKAKEILQLLLDKYAEHGIIQFENMDTLKASPFIDKFGKLSNIIKLIGGKDEYNKSLIEIENILYAS